MVAKSETFRGSIEDVRAFRAVLDFGTISAAARHLGETKGSVSRRLSRLETALGATLLARTSRSVKPTDEGRQFLQKATAALSLLDDAAEESRRARTVLRGAIRVTAPMDFTTEVLPEIVTEFRRMHPQITIEVLASDAVLDLVTNRADLALRVAFGGLPDMNYQAIAVADMEVGLFASPRYLAGRQPIEAPEALERHDWILARERPGVSHLPLSDGSREVKIALNPAIRTTDFAGVLRFVAAGAGLAPLPTLLTRKWIDEGSLVRILPAWAWSGLKLHAISAPGRQLSARVRAFRDHVIENLSR